MDESEGELKVFSLDTDKLRLQPGRLYVSKDVNIGCFPTPNLRTFMGGMTRPGQPLLFLGYARGENYNGSCYVLKFLTGESVAYTDIKNSCILRRMDDEGT